MAAHPSTFVSKISEYAKKTGVTSKQVVQEIRSYAPDCINEQGEIIPKGAKVLATVSCILDRRNSLTQEDKNDLDETLKNLPIITTKVTASLPEGNKNA